MAGRRFVTVCSDRTFMTTLRVSRHREQCQPQHHHPCCGDTPGTVYPLWGHCSDHRYICSDKRCRSARTRIHTSLAAHGQIDSSQSPMHCHHPMHSLLLLVCQSTAHCSGRTSASTAERTAFVTRKEATAQRSEQRRATTLSPEYP